MTKRGILPLTRPVVRGTVAALAAVLLAAAPGDDAAAQAKTLEMVGSWAPGVSEDADIALRFMDEVNRLAGDEVEIVYKGSKEVVPTFDQPEALVRGLFDVWYGAPNYWAGIAPAGYITELSNSEIPDHGPGSDLFQFMVDMYAEHGVRYLGHYAGDPQTGSHYLHLKPEISGIGDLKGLKIRVPPLTRFFVEAVGAEPVTLPPGEVYVAMDRGTVDGFTWPYFDGFTNFGWQEITNYTVNEPLYRNGVSIMMNMEAWDALSPEVQQAMEDAIASTQQWALGWVAAHDAVQLEAMRDAGMALIELPEEQSKEWRETANNALWQHFKDSMSNEDYTAARAMMGYE